MQSRPVSDPRIVIGNTFAELEVLHELCTSSELALNQKLEELHHRMDEDVAGLDEHREEAYLSDINDHYIMVSITMPMYQNYALFTLGFSFFEKCLNELSVQLRLHRGHAVDLKDIHGQGISRAKIYLSKVCGITEAFQRPSWSKALLFSEIRNTIAHRCGFLDYCPDDPRSLYSRLNGVPGIELEQVWDAADQPDRQMCFTNAFVVESLQAYHEVLRTLWSALDKRPQVNEQAK